MKKYLVIIKVEAPEDVLRYKRGTLEMITMRIQADNARRAIEISNAAISEDIAGIPLTYQAIELMEEAIIETAENNPRPAEPGNK